MNHYHADIVRYHLEAVLDHSTTIKAVADSTHIELTSKVGFLAGDTITITVGTTVHTTTIASYGVGANIVLGTAVAGMAPGQAVRFHLPHTLYSYASLDANGDIPTPVRPFVAVALPLQPNLRDMPSGQENEVALVDRTNVVIYVESPLTIKDGAAKRSGFDVAHLPAVAHIRDWIWSNAKLTIPSAIVDVYRGGTVKMVPRKTPEQLVRTDKGERHLFLVEVSEIVTIHKEA